MKNDKNENSFVSPCIHFIIFFINIRGLYYDAIYDFSVWLRTGSNPAYIDQFLSLAGKYFLTERNNFVEKSYFCFFSTKSITQVKTLAVKDCIMELVEYLI